MKRLEAAWGETPGRSSSFFLLLTEKTENEKTRKKKMKEEISMKEDTKADREAEKKEHAESLVSAKEREELIALGEKLSELEAEKIRTWAKAWEIIGFFNVEPEGQMDEDEELLESWGSGGDSKRMVFVAYAERARTRWTLEKAVREIRALAAKLDVDLDELDWEGRYEEGEDAQ